jgi:hypothetical protein
VLVSAVTALVLLLSGALWLFLQPRGSVTINTTPPGATVSLPGQRAKQSPATFSNIKSGAYQLKISLQGYEPIDRQFQVKPDTNLTVLDFPLVRATGSLLFRHTADGISFKVRQIKSDIGAGNEWVPQAGHTPASPSGLPTGTYEVTLQCPGWIDFVTNVTVAMNSPAIIDHPFVGGSLSLSAEPDTAAILIDDAVSPHRQWPVELLPGLHKIELKSSVDGYEPVTLQVAVLANQATNLGTIRLPRSTGAVRLASTPPGAVYQVEQVRSQVGATNEWTPQSGLTPADLEGLPTGSYRIVLHLGGWPDFATNIALQKGYPVEVANVFAGGTLQVSTDPPGAFIVVDGWTNGPVPATLLLPPGRHSVAARAAAPGYEPAISQVEISLDTLTNLGTLRLARSTGTLRVESVPAHLDCQVWQTNSEAGLANEWVPLSGVTPTNLEGLPTGTYAVLLQRPPWSNYIQTVTVDRTNPAVVAHDFEGGTISVSTEPTGAAILVDGKPMGQSPANINLPTGWHEVRAQYRDWPELKAVDVSLDKDKTNKVDFPLGGRVILTSDPPGALVLSDGRELGWTPLPLPDTKPGPVSYQLTLKGYNQTNLAGTVRAGEELPLSAQLQRAWPKPGAAWTDNLDLIFAPIPDPNVLFCIWDTRVKDYQAFTKETHRNWDTEGHAPGPTTPAILVSWYDARAFCAWLTEKDRQADLLSAHQRIRLPRDAEWSMAVGLGKEAGTTPAEKDGKIKGLFPWGREWPPREAVGNFVGGNGYHNDYRIASPVGVFSANQYGLYDMAGNVQQWCEDWFDMNRDERVLRGSSWNTTNTDELLSSYRGRNFPVNSNALTGFRCVVDLVPPQTFSQDVVAFRKLLGIDDEDDWQAIGVCIKAIHPDPPPGDSPTRHLRNAIEQIDKDKTGQKTKDQRFLEALRRYHEDRHWIPSDNSDTQQALIRMLTPQQEANAVLSGLIP